MLRRVLVPSKENSTVSIPAEFYGMEVEIVVYPIYAVSEAARLGERSISEQLKALQNFFDEVNASDEEIPETFERVNFSRKIDL